MARQNFPLDDLSYDLITIIHEKSKGLEAYDQYLQDAQGDNELRQVFQQIRDQDAKAIEKLRQHLGRVMQQGGRKAA
ncbi:MAG TPA: hypothetical protein VN577_18960 [Terriglobales bacterium]|nr:hypothetical protein [Terriglobales bacterium]